MPEPAVIQDRKSTRLNSSHSQISYAVFCLKKKMIVQSDKTVLLEVDHVLASSARAAIAPFAELERAPEHVHTYRVTPFALWNARAAGHDLQHTSVDSFGVGCTCVVLPPSAPSNTLARAASTAKATATTLILVTNTVAGRQ